MTLVLSFYVPARSLRSPPPLYLLNVSHKSVSYVTTLPATGYKNCSLSLSGCFKRKSKTFF